MTQELQFAVFNRETSTNNCRCGATFVIETVIMSLSTLFRGHSKSCNYLGHIISTPSVVRLPSNLSIVTSIIGRRDYSSLINRQTKGSEEWSINFRRARKRCSSFPILLDSGSQMLSISGGNLLVSIIKSMRELLCSV